MYLDIDIVNNIAIHFREAIVEAKHNHEYPERDRMSHFPYGCCDDAADLLAEHIFRLHEIESIRVAGDVFNNIEGITEYHHWLELNGTIVDITGDQFNDNAFLLKYSRKVYVGRGDDFHNLFGVRRWRSRGIQSIGVESHKRMYGLYDIIIGYI